MKELRDIFTNTEEHIKKMETERARHCHVKHGHTWELRIVTDLNETQAADVNGVAVGQQFRLEAIHDEDTQIMISPLALGINPEFFIVHSVGCGCCGVEYDDWQEMLKSMASERPN